MARILYADDNDDLRGSFERMLPRMGHEIVAVNDAARAWELLERGEKFDGIISDWEMPEMDGLTFMRKVRKDPRFAKIPFALISGRDSVGGRPLGDVCRESNAVYFDKMSLSVHDTIGPWIQSFQIS